MLIRILLNPELSFLKNTEDQDQLASKKAIRPGSTPFPACLKNMPETGLMQVNRLK